MIERLDLLNIEGHHNQIAIKINELIDIVKAHDKQIQACMQRTIDLEDTALDTKPMKFGECCKICGKELSLNQCEHTKQEKCLHADVGYPICPNCKQSVAGTGTMGDK